MKRRSFLKLICASPLAGLVKADESVKRPEYMGPNYYNELFDDIPFVRVSDEAPLIYRRESTPAQWILEVFQKTGKVSPFPLKARLFIDDVIWSEVNIYCSGRVVSLIHFPEKWKKIHYVCDYTRGEITANSWIEPFDFNDFFRKGQKAYF